MSGILVRIVLVVVLGAAAGFAIPMDIVPKESYSWDLAMLAQPLLDNRFIYSALLCLCVTLFFLIPIRAQTNRVVLISVAIFACLLLSNGFFLAGFFVFQENVVNLFLSLRHPEWQRILLLHPVVCGLICSMGVFQKKYE